MRIAISLIWVASTVATWSWLAQSAAEEEVVARDRSGDNLDAEITLPVGKFANPECTYSVHKAGENGSRIRTKVSIGEPLVHKWECAYKHRSSRSNVYCIMVHNCTVVARQPLTESRGNTSGTGASPIEIIDEFGCSLHPQILPHVEYGGDLAAKLNSNAFTLDINKPIVSFKCYIKLLLKIQGICRRPHCVPLEDYKQRASADESGSRFVE